MPKLEAHIRQAIREFGSQAKLAAHVGCSQQQIAYLLKADSISAEMAKKLDEATDGAVSRHDLRPDIFGPEPETAARPHVPPSKEGAAA